MNSTHGILAARILFACLMTAAPPSVQAKEGFFPLDRLPEQGLKYRSPELGDQFVIDWDRRV